MSTTTSQKPSSSIGTVLNDKMVCQYIHRVTSRGIWFGDNPFDYTTPVLMAELALMFIVNSITYYSLRPLRQSTVIVQIIGGIIIGPVILTANKELWGALFPLRSKLIVDTLAGFGITLHLFVLGVKIDASLIRHIGRKAVVIGLTAYAFPLVLGGSIFQIMQHNTHSDSKLGRGLLFTVTLNSVSSFAVISTLLTDLNILNSELGRLASSISMVSDACGWLLAVIVAGLGSALNFSAIKPLIGILVVLLYYSVMLFILRPLVMIIVRNTPKGKPLKEGHFLFILIIVLGIGFVGEALGQHSAVGAFIFGLLLPDGPPLATSLVEKLDTVASRMLLPIYCTMSGVKTVPHTLAGKGPLLIIEESIILAGYIGKFAGTILPSLYFEVPLWDAMSLALIMCCKGIMEIGVYTLLLDIQILDSRLYTLSVLNMVIITAIATFIVSFLYDPSRRYMAYKGRTILHSKKDQSLRMLVCIHNEGDVPPIIKLIEASNPTRGNPLSISVLQLMELAGRAAAILAPHHQLNITPYEKTRYEQIVNAFNYFERRSPANVMVQHFIAIAPYASMHNDICTLALDKMTSIIILPFHKQWAIDGTAESSSSSIRLVNKNVIEKSPCSVGIFINRRPVGGKQPVLMSQSFYRIAMLFLGGADDQEALAYSRLMAVQPNVSLTVVWFKSWGQGTDKNDSNNLESELIMNDFKANIAVSKRKMAYREEVVKDGEGTTQVIRSMENDFDLFIVGKHHELDSKVTLGFTEWSECPELGIIGDMLATSDFPFSVLVVQQPQGADADPSSPSPTTKHLPCLLVLSLSLSQRAVMSGIPNGEEVTRVCLRLPPEVNSKGVWGKSSPLKYSLPLLQLQLLLIYVVTQAVHFVLKRLGQPKIVSQIIAGLIVGETVLGKIKGFNEKMFPLESHDAIGTLSLIGYSLFMFLIGVKMHVDVVLKTGKKALATAVFGLFAPLIVGQTVSVLAGGILAKQGTNTGYLGLLSNIQSLTAFPVISSLLCDLKLVNSELGRLSLSSSLITDLFSVLLVTIGTTLQDAKNISPVVAAFDVGTATIFILGAVFIFRPAMFWVIRRTPEGRPVKDRYIMTIILAILGAGLVSNLFRQYVVFGPYILGLVVPDGPPLGSTLVEKLDTLVSGVWLPVFISVCAMRVDLFAVAWKNDDQLWFNMSLILIIFVTKIIATMLPPLYCKVPFFDALTVALIMSCQGAVELAAYTLLRDYQIINQTTFVSGVLAILFSASLVSTLVRHLYDPSRKYAGYQRRTIMHSRPDSELRILSCIHNPDSIAAMINLLDASCPTEEKPLAVYVLHLIELVGRASPLFISHQIQKRTDSDRSYSENIILAFAKYQKNNPETVNVQVFTAISPPKFMHEDICTLALNKLTSLIIFQFHQKWAVDGSIESEDRNIRTVINSVIDRAPCSVAIFVDRGHLGQSNSAVSTLWAYVIAMIFIGGSDDREALSLAKCMARDMSIRLMVIQFISTVEEEVNELEKKLDSQVLKDIKFNNIENRCVDFIEQRVEDGPQTALIVRAIANETDLIIVGRRHNVESPQTSGLADWCEYPELGIIGDLLASSDLDSKASVLVVQQQKLLS
ncbi:hypothetical protein L1049_012789 [Liquidambar formosana]|uniref:Cation/H+ exchanger domain-containing protein n=1 Tax=Liquidambar formosana TaxID=63359 RepID=A0AAP0WTI7_LIQFO